MPKWTGVDTSGQEVTRVLHVLHDLQCAQLSTVVSHARNRIPPNLLEGRRAIPQLPHGRSARL